MFGWKKKQNKITSYTQNPKLMELYNAYFTGGYAEALADMGELTLSNVVVQKATFRAGGEDKDLHEITTDIIFPAAAKNIKIHDLIHLHIWMETSGKAKEIAQDDAEMFLKYFMEEIGKLPKGWNEQES